MQQDQSKQQRNQATTNQASYETILQFVVACTGDAADFHDLLTYTVVALYLALSIITARPKQLNDRLFSTLCLMRN